MTLDDFIHAPKSLAMVITIGDYKRIKPLLQEFYSEKDFARIDDYCQFLPSSERFLLCNPYEKSQIRTPMMYLDAVTFIDRVPYKDIDFKNKDFVIEDDILVEYIGDEETVVIPEGIREIGINAFAGNVFVKHVVFPTSLEVIRSGAFSAVDLQDINFPEGLKTISQDAFVGCRSLKEVSIPASVVSLNVQAFNWCHNLERIDVDVNNKRYCSHQGILYSKFSKDSQQDLLRCPCGKSGEVVVQTSIDSVFGNAFANCSKLTGVVLPDTVRSIEMDAFACSSIEKIAIPKSVERIADYAFSDCTALKSVVLPDGIDMLGYNVFDGCHSLEEIVISDEALLDYVARFDFWDEVFMLPCYDVLYARYEALSKNGVDIVLADAQSRAEKPVVSENEREINK